MKKNKTPYLPDQRDFLEPDEHSLRSYSKAGSSYSPLPDYTLDPIVAQNISNVEFDYTEEDILRTGIEDEEEFD